MSFFVSVGYALLLLQLSVPEVISEDTKFSSRSLECRVVGGGDAQSATWYPSAVHLEDTQCGATILNSVWLVTAAHCRTLPYASVVAGNPFKCRGGRYQQIRTVAKVFEHKEFSGRPYLFNDIALLQIDEPLKFSHAVQPVKLIPKNYTFPDDTLATVVGWGWTRPKEPGSVAERLQQVDVPSVANETCTRILYKMKSLPHPGIICFGFVETGGYDSCQSDSGGPIYGTETGIPPSKSPWRDHILLGIVSFGDGCAEPQHPGYYTRVQYFLDWINKTMEDNPHPSNRSSVSKGFDGLQLALCFVGFILTLVNIV